MDSFDTPTKYIVAGTSCSVGTAAFLCAWAKMRCMNVTCITARSLMKFMAFTSFMGIGVGAMFSAVCKYMQIAISKKGMCCMMLSPVAATLIGTMMIIAPNMSIILPKTSCGKDSIDEKDNNTKDEFEEIIE